jgi:hypothetical protein
MKRKLEEDDHELSKSKKIKIENNDYTSHKYSKFLKGWKIKENESSLWKNEIMKELKNCVEKKQLDELYSIFHSIQKYFHHTFVLLLDLLTLNTNSIQWNYHK